MPKPASNSHPLDQYIGKRVRMRRTILGITQAELAHRVNLSPQQIQKYERGTNRIAVSTLWHLSDALETKPEYFWKNYIHQKKESETQSA